MVLAQVPAPQGVRRVDHLARGVPGGEMVVIQQPHAHSAGAGFFHNNIHIAPPARPVEIGVRASLNAYRTDAGFEDPRDLFADDRLFLAFLPQEGKEVVGFVV